MKITTNLVEKFPVFLIYILQYIDNQLFAGMGWIQVRQPKKKSTEMLAFFI
jgi:hypothetical protein